MFEKNTANKIKNTAIILFIFFTIINIISAIICFVGYNDLNHYNKDSTLLIYGFACLIVGPFLSWVFAIALYGLGILVETNEVISNEVLFNKRNYKK